MTKKMLIDATQPEETRVAVVDGERLDSYDFDSSVRKQIKGNIFLAKVTRVEPSLQACFVEYGGNRQGFLAFTEIHPDYYRIPMEDRNALLAEEAELLEDDEEEDISSGANRSRNDDSSDENAEEEGYSADEGEDETAHDDDSVAARHNDAERLTGEAPESEFEPAGDDFIGDAGASEAMPDAPNLTEVARDNTIERVGGEEEGGQQSRARRIGRLRKRYKIQEVIKRRQIMLVQATREERGQKGAAMTTYISLPGRYCVLMPNSPRGGGVSRKITDPRARRKMKDLLAELGIPAGMSVILRTAGIQRSKADIKRDLEYLLKLWDEIRRETMQSVAPALIYEEADIFKRTIRDLYSREISEVVVSGEIGYRRVKTFMHQMVPAHAPRVKFYRDPKVPLFQSYGVEHQIAGIFSPRVDLRSGGYIIINPTEALVSIDVNSGRATRERHIDDTALKTNLEAASEIARQLRLRDLGGLVVIDFIDMESNRHNAKVERRLREAMSSDRARIEIGRISGFGLMELSRQRLHPSLTETHFEVCAHCAGTGLIRTIDSAAIVAMRAIEAEAVRGRAVHITASVPQKVAVYILNHKREEMNRIEDYFGCRVSLHVDDTLNMNDFAINFDKGMPVPRKHVEELPVPFIEGVDDQPLVEDDLDEDLLADDNEAEDDATEEGEEGEGRRSRSGEGRRSRSRRGGRNRNRRNGESRQSDEGGEDDATIIPITEGDASAEAVDSGNDAEDRTAETGDVPAKENGNGRRRRGGRHPYRRNRDRKEDRGPAPEGSDDTAPRRIHAVEAPASEPASIVTADSFDAPRRAASGGADSSGDDKQRPWWQKLIE